MAREIVQEEIVLEIRLPNREATGKLPPLDWLTCAETKAIVAALTADGTEVRFVGGCVRDSIAKRPIKDIDIATPSSPDDVVRLLADAGIRSIPTGIAHGTVTALVGSQSFEITTLRKDIETDGRHAQVEFTDDWLEDAKRRDFTINAMSCSPDGDVYDPFDGMPDLAHGRIRFIGLASERVQEDYLRILRYFRFHGDYGRPPANVDAKSACRTYAAKLKTLSAERIRDEFLRIIMVPDPAEICLMMRGLGVLQEILPEAVNVARLRSVAWLANRALPADTVTPEPIRRLAALLDPKVGEQGALDVAQRLKLSNKATDQLATLAAPPVTVTPEVPDQELRRLCQRLGGETIRDIALLTWSGEIALTPRLPPARTQGWKATIDLADAWQDRVFPLKGRDVLDLGVPPGPAVGTHLETVKAWWESEDFAPDRAACLAKLKSVAGKAT